jgi:4-hydroxy-2-oxoglutarate aldolase
MGGTTYGGKKMGEVKEMLSGVFAPVATPFQDDEVSYKQLAENIEKMNESGLKGYFVLGTNGEYKSLSVVERLEVLKTVASYRSKDKVFMAGTGMESTKETIEMTHRAVDTGAQMVSLLMPHFFAKRIDDDVLVRYITEVADNSPVPVLIYNNPSVAAGISVSPEVVSRVSNHQNIVGMKDSSKGNYKGYLEAAGEGFYVLAGSAGFFLELLQAGGIGGVLSLANVFPDECARLYTLFTEKKTEEAADLSRRIVDLNKVVSGTSGVASVKAAMDLAGFHGGEPRRPISGITAQQREALKKALLERGFLR